MDLFGQIDSFRRIYVVRWSVGNWKIAKIDGVVVNPLTQNDAEIQSEQFLAFLVSNGENR